MVAALQDPGLRLGGLLIPRVTEIDVEAMLIHVRAGKVGRFRQVRLDESILLVLRHYLALPRRRSRLSTLWQRHAGIHRPDLYVNTISSSFRTPK